jgi:hypothetical protein
VSSAGRFCLPWLLPSFRIVADGLDNATTESLSPGDADRTP